VEISFVFAPTGAKKREREMFAECPAGKELARERVEEEKEERTGNGAIARDSSHLVNGRGHPQHLAVGVDEHVRFVANLVVTVGTEWSERRFEGA